MKLPSLVTRTLFVGRESGDVEAVVMGSVIISWLEDFIADLTVVCPPIRLLVVCKAWTRVVPKVAGFDVVEMNWMVSDVVMTNWKWWITQLELNGQEEITFLIIIQQLQTIIPQ